MLRNIKIKKLAVILGVICIASGLLTGIIFFMQYGISGFNPDNLESYANNIDTEKKADLQNVRTIHVESTSHSINLINTDSNELKAHFYGGYSSSSETYKPELIVTKNGDTLFVKIKENKDGLILSFRSNLKLDVYIPSQFGDSIVVNTSSGEVTSGDFSVKKLSFETSSGDIDTGSINAEKAVICTSSGTINFKGKFTELNIKSTSGDIQSENVEAETTAFRSNSGEIDISGSMGNIAAETTSGEIILSLSAQPNVIKINTSSGETKLTLPDTAGFKLKSQSNSGEINVDFPITITDTNKGNEHEISGTVGDGAGDVLITSTSGDISITK